MRPMGDPRTAGKGRRAEGRRGGRRNAGCRRRRREGGREGEEKEENTISTNSLYRQTPDQPHQRPLLVNDMELYKMVLNCIELY